MKDDPVRRYAAVLPSGEVGGVLRCPASEIDLQREEWPDGTRFYKLATDADPAKVLKQYRVGRRLVDRPEVGDPDRPEIELGEAARWTVTAGTELHVDGILLGSVEDAEMGFQPTLPGTYLVEIRPPFPWIGRTDIITCSLPTPPTSPS
jgi:hypothetical protein